MRCKSHGGPIDHQVRKLEILKLLIRAIPSYIEVIRSTIQVDSQIDTRCREIALAMERNAPLMVTTKPKY